jgi:hypothetical protein
VRPDLYLDLLLSHATSNSSSSTAFRIGCLRTLRSLLQGTKAEDLVDYRAKVVLALAEKDMVGSEHVPLLAEIALVVKVVVSKSVGNENLLIVGEESFTIFVILVTLKSVEGNEKIPSWTDMQRTVNTS